MQQESNTLSWVKLRCADTGKRAFHTSTLYKHYIVTIGGHDGENYRNDIIVFDTKTLLYSQVIPASGELPPISSHTACLYQDDRIIIFGGKNSDQKASNRVFVLTICNKQGFKIDVAIQKSHNDEAVARSDHSMVRHGDSLYVYGGFNLNPGPAIDLWRFNLESSTWTLCETSGDLPERCFGHSATVDEDKMYVFGGYSAGSITNKMYVLDLKALELQETVFTGNTSPESRSFSPLCIGEGINMYLFGGSSLTNSYSDLWCYDAKDNTWTEITITYEGSSIKRYGHSLTYYNGQLILWGGRISIDETSSDIYTVPLIDDTTNSKIRPVTDFASLVLKTLFSSKCFSDITFQVNGQEITAHKNIIAARSKFFDNMFLSGMVEAHAAKITITDISGQAFNAILEHIYCEEIVELSEDLALELLEPSGKYLLFELQRICEVYLSERLNQGNLIKIAQQAKLLDTGHLRTAVTRFLVDNFREIKEKIDLKEIPQDILIEAMHKLFP